MNIWQFQRKLSNRLLGWSIFSIISGTAMAQDTYIPLQTAGQQFVGWGAIDALIAIFGKRSASKRQRTLPDPLDPAVTAHEAKKLRRILLVNTGLDVLYMVGGYRFANSDSDPESSRKGHGYGIIIQGAFLFFFDLWHALRVRA